MGDVSLICFSFLMDAEITFLTNLFMGHGKDLWIS